MEATWFNFGSHSDTLNPIRLCAKGTEYTMDLLPVGQKPKTVRKSHKHLRSYLCYTLHSFWGKEYNSDSICNNINTILKKERNTNSTHVTLKWECSVSKLLFPKRYLFPLCSDCTVWYEAELFYQSSLTGWHWARTATNHLVTWRGRNNDRKRWDWVKQSITPLNHTLSDLSYLFLENKLQKLVGFSCKKSWLNMIKWRM